MGRSVEFGGVERRIGRSKGIGSMPHLAAGDKDLSQFIHVCEIAQMSMLSCNLTIGFDKADCSKDSRK
jgi:hypothetical protein